mgnify:CR=1 FL=1
MALTAEELQNINNSSLENYIEKGKVFKQNVANKPMLKAFDENRGSFSGGNFYVSVGVKSGQGGGSLAGFTADDQVSYYNPASNKRAKYPWKEHHIGISWTYTEGKVDGIDVTESETSTSAMSGREKHALANIIDEKNDDMGEDYAKSLDLLVHGDGTSDAKALAGIRSLLLEDPTTGTTGGISRAANSWWRNLALTDANSNTDVTGSVNDGGALLQAIQRTLRLLSVYAQGGTNWQFFCGTDFYDQMEKELRANGNYTQDGFMRESAVDGGMAALKFKGKPIIYDPTLDAISKQKFLYIIDMKRIKLLYMDGQRMKKHTPSRPYDRYVMFNGITTTAVMAAQQLNTSAIIELD